MSPSLRLGLAAGLSAYTLWGVLPLYIKLLDHLPAMEILAHRIVWSLPAGLLFVALAGRWADLKAALTPARLRYLSLSALAIGTNWFLYIWAVGEARVMEASLGYYINPLVNVLIGAVLLRERLRKAQWAAVALAAVGVLIMTQAFGRFPWIALVLCISFASYGLIRKRVLVDGRAGFAVEAALLFPIAAGGLLLHAAFGGGRLFGTGGTDIPLLMLAGPFTALPLILFALAAKRLMFATIGMMQYIAPTLQFGFALAFGEPFSATHALAFGFIWAALALFSADSVWGSHKARRLARAARVA